jgi:hypothetical protein
MSLPTSIAIYFIIWWVVLFAVLPWGVRNQQEQGTVTPGSDPGAPAIPSLKRQAPLDDHRRGGRVRDLARGLLVSADRARRSRSAHGRHAALAGRSEPSLRK